MLALTSSFVEFTYVICDTIVHVIMRILKFNFFNQLTATTAIWWFAVITHMAVRLTSKDMFPFVFLYPVCLF